MSVLTAALDERVTALCLLDPVDNTKCAACVSCQPYFRCTQPNVS